MKIFRISRDGKKQKSIKRSRKKEIIALKGCRF